MQRCIYYLRVIIREIRSDVHYTDERTYRQTNGHSGLYKQLRCLKKGRIRFFLSILIFNLLHEADVSSLLSFRITTEYNLKEYICNALNLY